MKTGNDLILNGELILSGDVLLDSWTGYMWEEDVFFSPAMVRQALQLLGEGRATVRLNSNGGHCDAGEQIRAILAGHPGGCRIIVEGIAASAASLIFMAGAERLMSAGSHLMIHDPSGAIWGNEEEARRQADQLGLVANTYAAVYAAASGKSVEECRAIMKAETWYGPEAAIAAGFADAVAQEGAQDGGQGDAQQTVPPPAQSAAPSPPSALASVQQAYMAARTRLQGRVTHPPAPGVGAPESHTSERATRPGSHPVGMTGTHQKEPAMGNETNPTNLAAPGTAAPQTAPLTMQITASEAVAQERMRQKSIREMAAPHVMAGRIAQADVDAMIDDGTSVTDAGTKILTKMAATDMPAAPGGMASTTMMGGGAGMGMGGGSRAVITRDETETRMEGMIGALMGKAEGPAQMFRGLRVRNLAMELSGARRGFNDVEAIKRGMASTTMMGGAYGVSDFAYITTEVMSRNLLSAYERRAASWQLVTGAPQTATDFREIHAIRFGGDFSLKKVRENGEYQQAVLSDEAEGLKVERRGRTITLTFEAIVNDDMGAFSRIPGEFAMAARTMENAMVWSLFRDNAKLKSDAKALFHTDHKNLAAGGSAISIASVGAGRKAMWEQRAFGTKDTDDFMSVEPNRLIVPPALEVVAMQFTAATTPATDGTVNPFKSTLTPGVVPNLGAAAGGSDTAWYLISSDLPPIAVAYLEGYAAPTVQTIEGMNPDAVVMNARHMFGAAAVEYRGAFKNVGA